MPLTLTYHGQTSVPVEIEGIRPDTVEDLTLSEIERLEIFHGNRKVPLGEFFRVSGEASDRQWHMEGDLSGVHWIGAQLASGSIHVHGSAGRHVGSEMTAGEIVVEGDAGDWVGGEMRGGTIRVQGRAGHLIGSAYRGSRVGMTGGSIFITGDAGNEVGHTMRRGLIAVGGQTGDMLGFNMLAGNVVILGNCGIRPGAGMRRGTLVLLGADPPPLLPTFRYACRCQPLALRLIARELLSHDVAVDPELADGLLGVDLYHGDLLDGGRGEIYLRA